MHITEPELVSGWGRNFSSLSKRARISSIDEAQEFLAKIDPSRGALPVGLHRSYGDSALNSGGTLIDLSSLNGIVINPDSQTATVGAGVTIRDLERAALVRSLFPPVVPGTGFVTMGGAVAAEIHGKSHHKTGSFSQCLNWIKLLLASGQVVQLFSSDEEFWATVGGLGLTGLILEVDLNLRPINSNSVDVTERRVKNLDQMIEVLNTSDIDYEHTVAWIDLSGDYRGRGVVSLGNYGSTPLKVGNAKSSGPSLPSVGGTNFISPLMW